MGEIIYNGRSSRDIGLEVETFPSYQTPKRTYEKVHIPGRNGDLLIDGGCWENVARTYLVSIGSYRRRYDEMMRVLSEWLYSSTTYARLEDTYEPQYYRMAVYLESLEISNIYNQGGQATIAFDCKPQRFLKAGEESYAVAKNSELQNPTAYESLPLIKVKGTGSGTLMVGDCTVTISEIGKELDLDCDIQEAYGPNPQGAAGTINKNPMITIPNGFPKLSVGSTKIGFSGGITGVEVIPRWFTL